MTAEALGVEAQMSEKDIMDSELGPFTSRRQTSSEQGVMSGSCPLADILA
jgi:hypothetical protein